MVLDNIVAFVVGLLVGALGIYVGGRVVADVDDYSYALVTALIATLVWVVLSVFVGWIPFLGPLIGLLAYVAILNYRYPGGWINAVAIALIAWLASLVVLWVLAVLGFTSLDAIGVAGA